MAQQRVTGFPVETAATGQPVVEGRAQEPQSKRGRYRRSAAGTGFVTQRGGTASYGITSAEHRFAIATFRSDANTHADAYSASGNDPVDLVGDDHPSGAKRGAEHRDVRPLAVEPAVRGLPLCPPDTVRTRRDVKGATLSRGGARPPGQFLAVEGSLSANPNPKLSTAKAPRTPVRND